MSSNRTKLRLNRDLRIKYLSGNLNINLRVPSVSIRSLQHAVVTLQHEEESSYNILY